MAMQQPDNTAPKKTGLKDFCLWSSSILLAVALLYHFAYKANWKEVLREIKEANLYWLSLAVLGEVVFILIRAARWKLILAPLERKISNWSLLKAQVVSFAISDVAPAKLGEVARPIFLSRWEGIPLATSFASIVLERGLDLIAIVFLWFLFIIFGRGGISMDSKPYMDALNVVSVVILVLGVIFVLALLWFTKRRKSFKKIAEGSSYLNKSPILAKLVSHFFVFAEGLQSFQKKRMIAILILISVLAWGSVSLTCYFAPKAVGVDLPKSSALLILTLVCIGASLPTPGGVGGVHKAIYVALVSFYGISEERAVSTALLSHAAMFLPSIVWGGLYLISGRVKFKDVSFSKGN